MSCAHQPPVDFPLSCWASPRQSWRVEASALACKGVDRCVACAAVSVSGTGAVVSVLSTESAFASTRRGGGHGTGPQTAGGAGPQIQAKVELNAQSESVRVHTHMNQLTYSHGEDFRVETSRSRAKCLVYFTLLSSH